jgi:drug/metabolite transporter (DMT)-like permease
MRSGVSTTSGPADAHRGQASMDLLLVLMVLIWGINYSVIKRAFEEVPPQPFNAVRLAIASAVYLVAIALARRRARRGRAPASSVFYTPHDLTRADRWSLLWVGLVGHLAYQWCFVAGVNGTSVSNAALIIGATPAVVAIASALLGQERITLVHWIGAAVSATGIYIVVGHGAALGGRTLGGDALVMVSVCCWAAYTLGAAGLMKRHSPLYVTGVTMAIGGLPYAAMLLPEVLRVDWLHVSAYTLIALPLSALLALCVAYLIWYAGVQRLGPARTSIYSNVVPLVAMVVARLWLDEPITPVKIAGAAAIVGGVVLTRLHRPAVAVPIEE